MDLRDGALRRLTPAAAAAWMLLLFHGPVRGARLLCIIVLLVVIIILVVFLFVIIGIVVVCACLPIHVPFPPAALVLLTSSTAQTAPASSVVAASV